MPVDLRPRLLLFPRGMDPVVILIDPTSLTGGTVVLPVVGALPYTLTLDGSSGALRVLVALATPGGDVFVSLDPFGATTGEQSTVSILGLGDVPYRVVLGPPAVPEHELALPGPLVLVVIGIIAWGLLHRLRKG